MTKSRLAAVLVTSNDSAVLESCLWGIHRVLQGQDYQLLVADRGSTDGTPELATEMARGLPIRVMRLGSESGYGTALRAGILQARRMADVVVTVDPAQRPDASVIPLMVDAIRCGSDVVVASRFARGARRFGARETRTIPARIAAFALVRLARFEGVSDCTSTFRAWDGRFLDQLVNRWGPDHFVDEPGELAIIELLAKAVYTGAAVNEIPVDSGAGRLAGSGRHAVRPADAIRLLRRIRKEAGGTASYGVAVERRQRELLSEGVGISLLSDVASVCAAFLMSFLIYSGLIRLGLVDRGPPDPERYSMLAALYSATTVFSFWRFGLYRSRLALPNFRHLEVVFQALTVSIALFFAVQFFATTRQPSRLLVFGALALSFPFLITTRRLVSNWIWGRRIRSGHSQRILIYGAGDTGRLLMKKILQAPRLGAEVVGFLDEHEPPDTVLRFRSSQMGTVHVEARVLGTIDDLPRIARQTRATELCVATGDISGQRLESLRNLTTQLGLELGIIPKFGDLRPDELRVEDLGALPVLRIESTNADWGRAFAKRMLDIIGVLVLAPLAVPVGLLTALAVRLEGKPVFFRQTRIGKGGRPFSLLKFRTMDPFAEAYAPSPTDDSDPRVTKVGGFIRRIGLDELPQLLNVLLGDMSLVGPRPEMPQIVAGYGRVERSRLSVRPGLTGIWQLSPERSAAIHENLDYDLYYVNRKSLTLDLLILGETVAFALRAMGRSMGLWLTGLKAVKPHRLPGPALSRANGFRRGSRSADGFVFVALDQRQRPHEPPTWASIVPRIRPLGESHRVKLLVARSNRDRLAELAPQESEHANGGGVEYVPYVKEAVKQLSFEADCVVTDLRHVADWASVAGVPTFLVDGGELHTSIQVRGQTGALASLVGSALGDGATGDAVTA